MQNVETSQAQRPSAAPLASAAACYPLPISKLRGVPFQVRVALKVRRITTCSQLLTAAALVEDREALARATRIAPEILTDLVRRADMARVNGVGAVFGLMLEELGIHDVAKLAAQDPEALHEQLRQYNRSERLARRSPTPEEVADWVEQARRLPKLVTYERGAAGQIAAE
jgi:nucleotidyltransferase/DNA polymerase involved in DNA repair